MIKIAPQTTKLAHIRRTQIRRIRSSSIKRSRWMIWLFSRNNNIESLRDDSYNKNTYTHSEVHINIRAHVSQQQQCGKDACEYFTTFGVDVAVDIVVRRWHRGGASVRWFRLCMYRCISCVCLFECICMMCTMRLQMCLRLRPKYCDANCVSSRPIWIKLEQSRTIALDSIRTSCLSVRRNTSSLSLSVSSYFGWYFPCNLPYEREMHPICMFLCVCLCLLPQRISFSLTDR